MPKKKRAAKPARKAKAKKVKRAFKPTEKIYQYNDFYGAKTRSERELNLETGNDQKMYNFVVRNKKRLLKKAKVDHAGTINEITSHGNLPQSSYGISPRNVRKKYLIDVIRGIDE